MKKYMTAKIELTNDKAIKCAKRNLTSELLNGNILVFAAEWTNKNTTEESFTKYVKNWMRFFEDFKRGYKIISVTMIEE